MTRAPGMTVRAFAAAAALLLLAAPLSYAQVAPPELPDLTPVALDPATTAFLVLDINSAVCPPRPACVSSVPTIGRLLAGEPVVTSRADKFFNTDLDQILKDQGVQTLLLVGSAANGAVMYSTFGAAAK